MWVALLASFPLLSPQLSVSAETGDDKNWLPDMGVAAPQSSANFSAGPSGARFDNNFGRQKVAVTSEYSNQTGLSIGTALASMLGDNAAVGVLLTAGADKKEWLINAGYKLDERQRFIVTAGQLEQFLDYSFRSGNEKVGMTQNSGALSYQLQLGHEFLHFLEVNGYIAKTASRDLADKTFAVDSATLFELWNDPRRLAGSKVTGLQGHLGFSPLVGSIVKVSFGHERLTYDLLTGKDRVNRLTGGIEWLQHLGRGYQLKAAVETFASQNRFALGVERGLAGSDGRHTLGASLVGLRGRDGLGDDNLIKLTYSYVFGVGNGRSGVIPMNPTANAAPGITSSAVGDSLLNQVAMRPSFIPNHVVAKVDNTVLPTRLIAVDKTALPAGASVNNNTGDIASPLGVAVTGIAGVTKNLVAFTNTGQFSMSGNSLVIKPSQIVQPAVGVIDSYVVTLNNLGGGTTLATILVVHGSVKIVSVTTTAGAAADITAPSTTAAPSVSATTATNTTLSVTINENGTGYYLIQAAAAAAPTVAAVQAGTAFAMSANVAASTAISGLSASTAYKIYFVAKDAANNVQAAVQSVALTTAGIVDATPPTTTVVPAVSGTTDTGATFSATINENGTGYYLVQAAAAAAPSVAAVQAGTAFAMSANVSASMAISGLTASTAYNIYFVAKDAANNVQAAVQSVALTTTAAANTAPSILTPPTNQTAGKNTASAASLVVNDAESEAASITLSATSSNPAIAPNANVVVTAGAGGNRTITVMPVAGATGTVTINYTASDGSLSTNGSYTVTFINAAPVISSTISNQTYTKLVAITPLVLPVANDADVGETVTYSISPSLPSGLSLNSVTRTISGTPFSFAPNTTYSYTAIDSSGATDTEFFDIVVQ